MTPKISIITVCFNAADIIEKTVLSVLSQSYTDYEYIIIDGGSTDGTMEVLNRYSKQIATIISEPDRGIYDAMNKGISKAHGEWVNFMNAGDTFVDSDVLSKVFEKSYTSDICFLYSDHYMMNSKGVPQLVHNDHIKGYMLHQSVIYKRSLHDTHGLYVVTPKIIISDVLFFFSIPDEQKKKIDIPISVNAYGGISAGDWCMPQLYCAKVIYRKYTVNQMIGHYLIYRIRRKFPWLYKLAKKIQTTW